MLLPPPCARHVNFNLLVSNKLHLSLYVIFCSLSFYEDFVYVYQYIGYWNRNITRISKSEMCVLVQH